MLTAICDSKSVLCNEYFSAMQFESLNAELEQNQELANSRMAELEKLQQELQEAVRESEKLKVAKVH